MPEYIEREATIKEATFMFDVALGYCKCVLVEDIEKQPTADVVEVRHGYWHLVNNCANEGVYCSVCNKKVYKTNYANQKIKSNYCPNCGAKMDSVQNE